MTSRPALLAAALTAGCAHAPRSDVKLGYTDHNLFVIEHHDPAHGGRIVGTVCDADLMLDARRVRDGIVLVGALIDRHNGEEAVHADPATGALEPGRTHELATHIEAHDDAARSERHIFGAVGDEPSWGDRRVPMSHGIDLVLSREHIGGSVGLRSFDLRARGDDYVGSVRLEDAQIPFVLRGAEQLWAMPAAAQASILPLLLTCTGPSKLIQLVDLRQSDTPPPSPPRWLPPPAQATRPTPPPPPGDVNRTPPPPPAAAQRARLAIARDDLR